MNLSLAPKSLGGMPVTKKGQITKEKQENNEYSRNYGSSPVFPFAVGELTAGAEEILDFFEDKPAMQKYGSFTNFIVQNNSGTTIQVFLNQDRNRVFTLPAGVIRSFEQSDIQGGVLSLIVKNSGSVTATAGLVTVEVFKVGVEIESSFQKLHKKFFKLGGY